VMGTSFATGQAAGVAAALTARGPAAEAPAVQRELRRQGAILDYAHAPVVPTEAL